jgi:hypothetical protein
VVFPLQSLRCAAQSNARQERALRGWIVFGL